MQTRAQVSGELGAASQAGKEGPGVWEQKPHDEAEPGTLLGAVRGRAPARALGGASGTKDLAADCGDRGSACLVLESPFFFKCFPLNLIHPTEPPWDLFFGRKMYTILTQ